MPYMHQGQYEASFKVGNKDNGGEAEAGEVLPQGHEVVAQCKHNGSVQGTLYDRHGRHSIKYTYVQNRNNFTAQKQLRIACFLSFWSLQEN